MMDDYANRQAARDREYADYYRSPEYLRWVDGLSPAERRRLEAEGLLAPMIDRSGSTLRDEDASETSTASETPDFAAAIDGESSPVALPGENVDEKVMDVLRRLLGEVLTQKNVRLTLECLAVACGLSTLEGESMSSIAKRHGLTRAAVSKRCVDITEKLNLPPSRSMRSTAARTAYRRVQKDLRNIYERTRDHRP
jgi:hypothetical protein